MVALFPDVDISIQDYWTIEALLIDGDGSTGVVPQRALKGLASILVYMESRDLR